MLTRRQLLLSAAVLGTSAGIALPLAAQPNGSLRLGLLQSRRPFVDPYDIAGSRARAFHAYRTLVRRSLNGRSDLDWLAGGAFPLSGPGPFPLPVLEQLALSEHSTEFQWLSKLARAQRISITLGVWWRDSHNHIAHRLLEFDRNGAGQALLPEEYFGAKGIQLHMPEVTSTPSLAALASQCGRLGLYGAWVEMPQGPVLPPGVPLAAVPGSAIIGPDGRLMAQADSQTEACLVAELA